MCFIDMNHTCKCDKDRCVSYQAWPLATHVFFKFKCESMLTYTSFEESDYDSVRRLSNGYFALHIQYNIMAYQAIKINIHQHTHSNSDIKMTTSLSQLITYTTIWAPYTTCTLVVVDTVLSSLVPWPTNQRYSSRK